MFRKKTDPKSAKEKKSEKKDFFTLPGNNYDVNKLILLKTQLSNYIEIMDKSRKQFKFCHIYASGIVDDGGYPGNHEIKKPTFQLSFLWKKGSLLYNDITKLFHTSYSKNFSKFIAEMKQSLCLVISVEKTEHFQDVIKKIGDMNANQIPPIIVIANKACYTDVFNLANKIDLGIATIIQTYQYGARFEPMNLYYMSTPPVSSEKVNIVWKELTVAIQSLISQSKKFLIEEVDNALLQHPKEINNIMASYAMPKI